MVWRTSVTGKALTVRVLVLTNLYPPNAMGGYELSCRDVVDRWRRRGHEVLVLTTAGAITGVVEPSVAEPHVRRELRWYWENHVFTKPSGQALRALELHNQERLQAALSDFLPDVASVWHMGGMSLSLLTALERNGLPLVCNVCDEWPHYAPKVDAWMAKWSGRPAWWRRIGEVRAGVPTELPLLDRHAASFVSAFTLEAVRRRGRWSFPAAEVVGSGVDERDFPAVAGPTTRPWDWQLLGVGRIEPRKGFGSAVSALAHLPAQARLRLVGVTDPDHERELLALAKADGVQDRVVMGAVARSDLRGLYAEADVVVFPSRWEEPFGLVPLEAMTQGIPVVATRRGGSKEFLEDGVNCLAIPADDPAALASAVKRLAEDEALRSALATGGLRTAARYTVGRLADSLERIHVAAALPGAGG